ncbi:hypothetical protein EST38_g1706 [Candolleomyces aberdarensis]|uniref:L-methionine transporter n=1 Tax=Candolleomyces aberdarensis TaxID=2316362 RepID=A0A4V1Q528_9AGAR|nr:hypothetical protein EST38_g1706 [Candolleomyces aberdarensis]
MSNTSREEYVVLRSPQRQQYRLPSPRHSPRHSEDSDDSLRALEVAAGPAGGPGTTGRGRSYSLTGFDYQRDLIPLSASVTEPAIDQQDTGEKSIGLVNGIALIVGLQIGSGIFSSPGVVVANTQSVGASMLVWLASGVLGWTGASSFAELGSAIPQNGGAQAYLAYAYGPLVSYLFAWTAIIALKPGGNAVISLIFAEYINRLFMSHSREEVSPDDIPQWAIKLTAVAAVLVVTILCIAARKLGTRVAVVFTTLKIIALILVTTLGIVQLARGKASSSLRGNLFEGSSHSPSSYSLALYSGLWAFDGWDQANYVGGEIHHPEKNIPRAIHSRSFYTSSRLVYAAGRERYLPAMFGRLHSTRKTPLNATLLQATITIAFIVIGGGFRSLINFSVVASWAFYFLTVLGLVILRIKEPMLERPYKTWIITPLIFCGVALFLLCMPIIAAPIEAIAVLGFIAAGVPVYYLTQADEDAKPRIISIFEDLFSRLRGRPSAADGWEAVATDGDDTLEMTQTQTRNSR